MGESPDKKGRVGRSKSVKQTAAYGEILASSSRLDIDNYDQTDEKRKVDESEDVPTANKRSRAMTVIQKKNKNPSKQQLADNLFTVEALDQNNSAQVTLDNDGEKNDEIPVNQEDDDEIIANFKVINEDDKP